MPLLIMLPDSDAEDISGNRLRDEMEIGSESFLGTIRSRKVK